MIQDALGNNIIIGNVYGYSTNKNGFSYVTIGEVVKINDKTVILKITYRKRALYDKEFKTDYVPNNAKATLRGYQLFPVLMDNLKICFDC